MVLQIAHSFNEIKQRFNKINPFLVAVIFFILIFFILILFNRDMPSGDASEYCNNAYRFFKGDLPYKDFWLMFPPGELYFPALIFFFFGFKYQALFMFLMFSSALIGFLSFFLARRFTRDNFWAMIIAIIVQFSGVPQFYGPNDGAHIYLLFLLVAALFFFKDKYEMRPLLMFFAGAFIGLASLCRFFETGAFGLSLLCTTFWRAYITKADFKRVIQGLFYLFAGVFFLLFFAYLPLRSVFNSAFEEIIIHSIRHGTSGVFNLPYFYTTSVFLETLVDIFYAPNIFDLSWITSLAGITWRLLFNVIYQLLIPLAIIALIVLFIKFKVLSEFEFALLFFVLWGIFSFPKGYAIPDRAHLSVAVTPLLFGFVLFVKRYCNFKTDRAKVLQNIVCFLAYLSVILLLISTPLFIGVSLINGFSSNQYEINAPEEKIFINNKERAAESNLLIKFVEDNSEKGDYIFVSPFDTPPLYMFTQRKNPTYYDSTIDLLTNDSSSEEKQKNICDDISSKKTKLIIHSDCLLEMWGKCKSNLPILERCINESYSLNRSYGKYKLYLPRKG